MQKNLFNQMAQKYDNDGRKALAHLAVQQLKPRLQQHQSKTLLDYGGGTGLVSLELVDQVQSLVIADAAAQMIDVAQEKIHQQNIANAQAIVANFTEEGPQVKADVIIVSLVLLHIPDTEKILQALYDALYDGGELFIIDFDKNERVSHPLVHSGFDHTALAGQLTTAGFHQIDIETFHHGKNIFMNEDASMFIASCKK